MSDLRMFIPLTKIDVAKRLVYGIATAEAEDAAGEVCDYESTKPYYESWSGGISKATGGKSLGNLRSMHGPIAAGKVTHIEFNDAAKQIEICAKVVDDAEWNKVIEGVYTGFSQGGAYVKRWKDGDVTRYTANPAEISLVDLPCLPSATFSVIKADGEVELRKFNVKEVSAPMVTNSQIADRAAQLAKAAGVESWGEFVEAARADLEKDRVPPAHGGSVTIEAIDGDAIVHDESAYDNKTADGKDPVDDDAEGQGKAGLDADESAKTEKEEDKVSTPDMSVQSKNGESKKALTPTNNEHGVQKWQSNRDPSQLFDKKADMVAFNESFDAAKIAAEKTGGIAQILANVQAEVAKRTFTPAERKKDAKSGRAESDGSYPIENAGDLHNAVMAYGRSSDKPKTKAHIIERAKSLGITDELPKGWDGSTKKMTYIAQMGLEKGLPTVARLAGLIESMNDVKCAVHRESMQEGDNSPLPALMLQNIDDLCATLRTMVEEETHELTNHQNVDDMAICDAEGSYPYFSYALGLDDKIFGAIRKFFPNPIADKLIEKRAVAKVKAEQDAAELAKAAEAETVKKAEEEVNRQILLNKALEKTIEDMSVTMASVLDEVKKIAEQPLPLPLGAGTSVQMTEADAAVAAEVRRMQEDKGYAALQHFKFAPRMVVEGSR